MVELTPNVLARTAPRDRVELHAWLWLMLGIDVPPRGVCAGHVSPLDYLDHVFFEREPDVLVWANRGGGKTFYGAVATLLDMLFKPGIEIRILGGSMRQSHQMYTHLRRFLERPGLRDMVYGRLGLQRVRLINGSGTELLSQSERCVRGNRVQKLRCDEVDLFDVDVWASAQFITRSARCGEVDVRGAVECMSTLHRPFGLMHELVVQAERRDAYRLFQWCAMDVMAKCSLAVPCEQCKLHYACGGKAKSGRGFVPVYDVLNQQMRTSRERFDSEVLCARPSMRNLVYPMFSAGKHVKSIGLRDGAEWIGGMDFGLRSPMVMLWAQVWDDAAGRHVAVMDEYMAKDRTVDENLKHIAGRMWPRPRWIGIDPAGQARNEQTGVSTASRVARAGYAVKAARMSVPEGVELVRSYLDPADGGATRLTIDPRCRRLIQSLNAYHFADDRDTCENPVKDGPDHAADALRYMLTNLHRRSWRVERRNW